MNKGKSPEYIRALSDTLIKALVEHFDVPTNDRFQVIHQLESNEAEDWSFADGVASMIPEN